MKNDMKAMAKKHSLEMLKKMMTEDIGKSAGDKVSSMKKVTVAAPDDESLKEGLDIAKKKVEEMPSMESEDESPEEDASPEEETESPEELQAKIKELQDKLASLKK